jgi:hypothetical protein
VAEPLKTVSEPNRWFLSPKVQRLNRISTIHIIFAIQFIFAILIIFAIPFIFTDLLRNPADLPKNSTNLVKNYQGTKIFQLAKKTNVQFHFIKKAAFHSCQTVNKVVVKRFRSLGLSGPLRCPGGRTGTSRQI